MIEISFKMPKQVVPEAPITPSGRITRGAARRSSIIVEELPLRPFQARKSVRAKIVYSDDESDTEAKDKSYRNVPINLPNKRKSVVNKPTKLEKVPEKKAEQKPIIKKDNRKDVECIVISSDEEEEFITPISPVKARVILTPKKIGRLSQSPLSSPTKLLLTPRKKKSLEDIENMGNVTPPKLKKTEDNGQILFSPTSLFKKLDLNSPKKQKDFEDTRTVYQNARKALHSTVPVEMPGRETEHQELRTFITQHLKEQSSGTLYVSGPPGTGKTASLSKILKEPEIESQFKEVYVNCTAIKSSGSIYSRIIKELGIKTSSKTEKECIGVIENYLGRNHKMILLVLDEIDQLESRNQSVLYTIFEWPSRSNYKLVLIGIANALDLTDRILPRLQARLELKPKLMHFAPYTKPQIVDIFTNRLKTAGVLDLFHPVAVQMLAGKVAAISGDVRRALDIGRRVVEIVEQLKKQETLKSIENHNIPDVGLQSANKAVDLKHVVGVLNSVYGTSNNLNNEDGEDSFPLQQKIVVCTLLLIIKQARNKDVTIGKLHDVYRKVCTKRNLLAVDQAEFVGLCSLIETRGILRVFGRKEPRLHKVTLEWDEEEVCGALRDKQLMSMILQDTSVLGKM